MKKTTLLTILALAATSIHLFAQTTAPAPYCVATFDDDPFLVDDAIKSVAFGTLNNVTNAQYAAPHYVFYNNLAVPNFVKGSSGNTLKVVFDVKGGAGYGIWIDYNQNNVFEPSEKVSGTPIATSLDLTSNTTITESLTIPASAATGQTRMRVRIVEDDDFTFGPNGYAILPCNLSASAFDEMDWGETEDYTINIMAPTGINEVRKLNNLVLYPNPVTNMLSLQQDFKSGMTFRIINILGEELQNGHISNANKQINVSALAEGIYVLQLFDNNEVLGQQRFVKSK